MKIGMKEDMDIADKMTLSNLVSRSTHNYTHAKCALTHLFAVFGRLEGKDCNDNLYEGGHGHCQRNNIIKFGIAQFA